MRSAARQERRCLRGILPDKGHLLRHGEFADRPPLQQRRALGRVGEVHQIRRERNIVSYSATSAFQQNDDNGWKCSVRDMETPEAGRRSVRTRRMTRRGTDIVAQAGEAQPPRRDAVIFANRRLWIRTAKSAHALVPISEIILKNEIVRCSEWPAPHRLTPQHA